MTDFLARCLSRIGYLISLAVTMPFRTLVTAMHPVFSSQEAFGIRIAALDDTTSEPRALVNKVTIALTIIQDWDSRRLGPAGNHISRIFIAANVKGLAVYLPNSNSCVLNARVVAEYADSDLATILVHEMTHARIERAGVRAWPDLRRRIERRCVIEEISFAKRLPPNVFPWVERWIDFRCSREAGLAEALNRSNRQS